MRSALICVFIAIVVHKEGSRAEDVDFQPTPIPLNEWTGGKRYPAETLQEFFKTDTPPTVAALPAHYWEDALRHSVYLSLVRDKIDELIAKGSFMLENSEPYSLSKEIDDHDLWNKIKTAPFDRVKEDPLPPGDVNILARGKLFEDKEGYRFAEDDAFSDKCSKDNCTQTIKAYWSVKRVRQTEKTPGKYHYELTFSVTSQPPKKIKETYENPMRIFTIRENTPKEQPQLTTSRQPEHQQQTTRGQRAVWVHANIQSNTPHYKRQVKPHTLERIFASLFTDENDYAEVPSRYKPNSNLPKLSDNSYNHKQPPNLSLLPRPPIQAPPLYNLRPNINFDKGIFSQHIPLHQNHHYLRPNPIKSNKQTVLPKPTSYQLSKESSEDAPVRTTLNVTEHTTKQPEIITNSHKYQRHLVTLKGNHFLGNIRTPVYNAPPGVFVTMDKKPFKPMPPLRLPSSNKPQKTTPLDFRPSPQILDDSNNDSDFLNDTAFRPITLNFTDLTNRKKGTKIQQKKPSKKHDHVKYQRITTVSPDIITVRSNLSEEQESLHWVQVLGAFTKTTPTATQNDEDFLDILDINLNTTTVNPTTTTEYVEDETTTKISASSTSTTTTTKIPKRKRTRPPPKFKRTEKTKKDKRIITNSTTTAKPQRQTLTKPYDDLMPQASSAPSNESSFVRENKQIDEFNSSVSTTTTTSTNIPLTTTRTTTARVPIFFTTLSNSKIDDDSSNSQTQVKSKNRFRQSTLMLKGTSVKHDKWSASVSEKNKTQTQTPQKFLRRKASKFQGYVPLATPRPQDKDRIRDDHEDHGFSSNRTSIASDNNNFTVITPIPAEKNYDDINYLFDFNDKKNENTEVDSKTVDKNKRDNLITDDIISPEKNHTKCKKKKSANLTTTEIATEPSELETTTVILPTTTDTDFKTETSFIHDLFVEPSKQTSSTERPLGIFDVMLNEFTVSDDWNTPQPSSVQTIQNTMEEYLDGLRHSSTIEHLNNYDADETGYSESTLNVNYSDNSKRQSDDYYYDELDSRADGNQEHLSLFGLMS